MESRKVPYLMSQSKHCRKNKTGQFKSSEQSIHNPKKDNSGIFIGFPLVFSGGIKKSMW